MCIHVHVQDEEDGVMDIFGYIDLIQDCLSKAETSESLCLDGISKADIALRQTKEDPDIQCIVLMKRAELLYIAVRMLCVFVCGGGGGGCVCLVITMSDYKSHRIASRLGKLVVSYNTQLPFYCPFY